MARRFIVLSLAGVTVVSLLAGCGQTQSISSRAAAKHISVTQPYENDSNSASATNAVTSNAVTTPGMDTTSNSALNTPSGPALQAGVAGKTSVEISVLHMIDPLHGWALGQVSNSDSPLSAVFRTDDGGKTWVNVTPPHMISSKFALNQGYSTPTATWIAAVVPNRTIQVYRTTDGGKTWTSETPNRTRYGGGMLKLQFVNDKVGYMEDSDAGNAMLGGDLFQTTNGGQTWTLVSTTNYRTQTGKHNLPFAGQIHFVTASNGWLSGGERAAGPFGGPGFLWFFRTTNGGVSWIPQSLPVPEKYRQAITSVSGPNIFGKIGYVGVTYDVPGKPIEQTLLYKTDNAGNTWSTLQTPSGDARSYKFLNTKVGYIYLDSGALYFTTNGGETWVRVSKKTFPYNFVLDGFVNRSDGWAELVHPRNTEMLQTTDGGKTWSQENPIVLRAGAVD